ncbi:MAG: GAF domain-containing protein, partial [Stellaceae bacterium]
VGSGADYSHAPEFVEARANGSWFSPVSFRKESEPYMTLALADAGRNSGVTVASINLKLIWDVITALKIGEGGYAYVVDGRGKLIADPDISLVLRDTDFSKLPQVAAVLASKSADGEPAQTPTATAADDYYGRPVLSAHARIKPVGWRVFVEVPLKEAYAPLYALALRNVLWLVLALAGAALAAFLLARRMISPIHALQTGAAQIGAGDLDRRIDIHTGDELEALAQQFNHMAADLQTSYAELEHKVEERTAELSESLEYQTATSDVLKVISRSTFDLQPVLDTLVETAAQLCSADLGMISHRENDGFRVAATHATSPEYEAFIRGHLLPLGQGSVAGRAAAGGRVVQVTDLAADPDFVVAETVTIGKIRTAIGVPLMREGVVIGIISLGRARVEPFTDRQIELVRTFADQAVIAIENARLIAETQEALDQQTATAEVLGVINASPGDLKPVFDAILEKAQRLCGVAFGTLELFDGQNFRAVATLGISDAFAALLAKGHPVGEGGRPLLEGARYNHILDQAALPDSFNRAAVELDNHRTVLLVPLRREGRLLGMIVSARKEVRAFTEKEIALLESFAGQAVIAMENARLLTETREALEQQTATAEVLQVINSSPGDLAPVFEAMVERAVRLCGADEALVRTFDGEKLHLAAAHGPPGEAETLRQLGPALLSGMYEFLARGQSVSHVADVRETAAYQLPLGRARLDARHIRSWLGVALRKDGALLGVINVHRREVRPFSEKQIELLQNFAAQAVIAIENARLLGEIRQRQAELRVTFDNMGDGVVMFDGDLRLTAWNKNFQELLDLPNAVLEKRKTYTEYLHILAERGEFGSGDVEEELSRRLAHADEELRFERTRPDGRVLEVRRNPVAGGGFVLIYSDITERKRSEEEIRTARDAAEAALRDLQTAQRRLIQAEKMASLGQLTAGIAHEIKNPLNFVNNFASLSNELLSELKEVAEPAIAKLDPDKREELDETMEMLSGNLEKIAEHGRRADNIVKSMLEHSRGVSGERRAVDLNALVEESLNLAYHGARAQDQTFNITLEREFDQKLRPIELVPQDMTRVFLNLIGNGFYAANKRAQKSGNGFRPVLRVATHEAGDAVEVKVRDNGTGIPADIRDKLFQPFFTTKPTGEGTGLGLSISYDIVTQQHGGTIAVDSAEDEFTEFTIRLPRQTPGSGASA